MKIFRIASKEYIHDISGTGAKLHGGRWNQKGSPLLYTAENSSLAILEMLVHFDGLTIAKNLNILYLEIDDLLIKKYSNTKFKTISKAKNAEYQFKEEGQKWLKSKATLALKVPSIINPRETNILINPLHKNFSLLKKGKVEVLDLDERFFRK